MTNAALLEEALAGNTFLLFDGAMGSMLQQRGMPAGSMPDLQNLSAPSVVTDVHAAYVAAGSQVITTNTFRSNERKLGDDATVEQMYETAVQLARAACPALVAGDIGPTGMMLAPMGPLPFEDAFHLFARQAQAAEAAGADFILVETMGDVREAKAAVLAARETTQLPVLATMSFGLDGRTFLGTTPEAAAITLESAGAQAVGVNCSQGPEALADVVRRMAAVCSVPLIAQANAGIPQLKDGRTEYPLDAEAYAQAAVALLDAGATLVGGCCGTTPEHIAALARMLQTRQPQRTVPAAALRITSARSALVLPSGEQRVAVVGNRINAATQQEVQQALADDDFDELASIALDAEDAGAHIVDVNVSLPQMDQAITLCSALDAIGSLCALPVRIHSADASAIEAAVRGYAGKPIIDAVDASADSLNTVLPVVERYRCAVVGRTCDENGTPQTADERVAMAQRIIDATQQRGIDNSNVIIDCMAPVSSANDETIQQVLQTVRRVNQLGVKTLLDMSAIDADSSPDGAAAAAFMSAAFECGLNLVVMDPENQHCVDAVEAYKAAHPERVVSA